MKECKLTRSMAHPALRAPLSFWRNFLHKRGITNLILLILLIGAIGVQTISCSSDGDTNAIPSADDFYISGTGTIYYDGNTKSVSITPKTGKSNGAVTIYYKGMEGTSYPVSVSAPSAIGKYEVTFDVAEAAGWNAVSGYFAGTLDIASGIPDVPTGVSATVLSASSVRVNWSSVSRANSYNVYYSTTSSGTPTLAGTANGTTYTHSSLSSGNTYYFYVTAVNEYGESEHSSSYSASTSAPNAPTGLVATATSNSTIDLKWNAVPGATGYRTYMATSSGGTKQAGSIGYTTGANWYNLSAETTYYFWVVAINSVGTSSYSSMAYATTPRWF